jgi:hypothetical protein
VLLDSQGGCRQVVSRWISFDCKLELREGELGTGETVMEALGSPSWVAGMAEIREMKCVAVGGWPSSCSDCSMTRGFTTRAFLSSNQRIKPNATGHEPRASGMTHTSLSLSSTPSQKVPQMTTASDGWPHARRRLLPSTNGTDIRANHVTSTPLSIASHAGMHL